MHRNDFASTLTSEPTGRSALLAGPADKRTVRAPSIAVDAALMIVRLALALEKAFKAPIRISFRRPGIRCRGLHPRRKLSRSALMVSASVVGMPWGKPL